MCVARPLRAAQQEHSSGRRNRGRLHHPRHRSASCPPWEMEHGLGATKPHRLAGGDGICSELELGDAGLALGAVLGRSAMLMWGVGLFVAGQASVLATTYAGQAIMDGCLRMENESRGEANIAQGRWRSRL